MKCPLGHEHVDVNDCYWRRLWEPGPRATGPEPPRAPEDEDDMPDEALVDGSRHETQSSVLCDCRGISFILEYTQMTGTAVNDDSGPPLAGPGIPIYPAKLGRRSSSGADVSSVNDAGNGSQIRASAIESVSVDVVTNLSVTSREPENFPVKFDALATPCRTTSIVVIPIRVSIWSQTPSPLVHPVGVSGIDHGVGADGAISGSEGDTYGILKAHRVPPELGVVPRPVLAGAGLSCVNYTTPFRVERCYA